MECKTPKFNSGIFCYLLNSNQFQIRLIFMGMMDTGNPYLDGELRCTKMLMLLGISWNKKSCNIGLWTTTLQGTNLTFSLPLDFWIHAYPFLQVGCVCSLEGINPSDSISQIGWK